ncbi:LysE family translocator [Dichotomicrobium thermohalophilum]|uniref:Threonine/homoserine/homoserine lactone efflux protein n=1 Tax=Dichotomicrobium thermohalophilum TaxID=933063 RepID=A0A397QAJ5_9HYPH|nr:LysE family translocator [Dichotomicrobium thermohalophilum]RIA56517.1 threonine/homoserine/homoserine lactone efflux protein [Dichotomicrobium thermohalophilum]
MPAPEVLLAFAAVCFAAAIAPGPDILLISSRAVARGPLGGALAAFGVVTGLSVHILLAATGLTALFASSMAAFEVIRWAGVGYLLYLAWGLLRDSGDGPASDQPSAMRQYSSLFVQGLLTNLLNPKAVLFFLALLPQFVDPARGLVPIQIAILGLELMVIALAVFLSVAYLVGILGRGLARSPWLMRLQNRVFGGALAGTAIWLALAERR